MMTEVKIAEINADVELYTDGSTSGVQVNGGAGIFVQDSRGNVLLEKAMTAGSRGDDRSHQLGSEP